MKRIRAFFAGLAGIFAALALAACGGGSQDGEVVMQATILRAEGGYLLIAPNNEEGTVTDTSRVLSTSVKDREVLDENGAPLAIERLAAGQTVDVLYDGVILESYPGQIACRKITVTGSQPPEWVNPIELDEFFNRQPDPDPDSPYAGMPAMGVEYAAGQAVSYTPAVYGSSNWYEDVEGVAVDSVLPGDGLDRVPSIEAAEGFGSAELLFSREPEAFSVRYWDFAEEWKDESTAKKVALDGGAHRFQFPEKMGKYLYEVSAEWAEGRVSYYFALDNPPFVLKMEQEIPLSAGEAAYTLENRTGKEAEVFLIPQLERMGEDGWETLPLSEAFCGAPDPLAESREGAVPFAWWPDLAEAGQYRLSFACEQDGAEYRPACVFSITEG